MLKRQNINNNDNNNKVNNNDNNNRMNNNNNNNEINNNNKRNNESERRTIKHSFPQETRPVLQNINTSLSNCKVHAANGHLL